MKKAVIIVTTKGEHFFLSKRLDKRKPFFNMWQCPGGSVDQGEDNVTAACRELEEEMGISIFPTDLNYISQRVRTYRNGVKYLAINYHYEIPEHVYPEQTEPHKSSEWEPFTLDEMEDLNIIPGVQQICATIKDKQFICI